MPSEEKIKAPAFLDEGKLHFVHLPAYAKFLLENRLLDLVTFNLKITRQSGLHLLKYFDFMDDEKIIELSKVSTSAFLNAIIENKVEGYIQASIQKWKDNQLPLIARDQIVAEDIALTSFLRKKGFQNFLPEFTTDVQLCIEILGELDEFMLRHQATSFKTFTDIQQEKLNELNLNLKKSEDQLLEAQKLGNVGSFDWDLVGNQSYFTPELFNIFNIDKPAKFSSFLEFVHPDDRTKLETSIEAAINGDGIYECEYRYKKDGSEKRIWSRGIVSFLNGRAHRMRGTVMDVTERYKTIEQLAELNASLERKNAELERSNKELNSFGYVASHDLQEPLRNIKIFSNMLTEREGPNVTDKGKHLLSRIVAATGKMQRLIDDLLTFSRTQTYTADFTPVDLNTILAEITTLYSDSILDHKMKVTTDPLPVVNGIAFQLHQLFDNVFTNAVKYSKTDTPLSIEVHCKIIDGQSLAPQGGLAEKKYHQISISDNGIGFEQKYADKIFEIFQRLHGKDEYSGTGIGLAICKRIVQNHAGLIYAMGELDKGTTIYICLPA